MTRKTWSNRVYLVAPTLVFILCLGQLFAIQENPDTAGRIITAVSGRRADLQQAVSQAVSGDTVLIPPGDFPFDGPLTVPAGIELRGAGRDLTILRKAGTYPVMITVDASNGERILFSGIKLVGTGDHATLELGLNLTNNPVDFRVFESEFEGWGAHGLTVRGNARGVIDHCRFINCYVPGHGYGVYVWGDNEQSWLRPLDLGTENAVYVEDCYFSGCRHAIASGYGARYVFRHNRIEANSRAEAVNAHGPAPPYGIRGTRSVEIYNNTMVGGGPGVAVDGVGVPDYIGLYSGDGVVFNNTLLKHPSSPASYDDAGWMAIIDISYSCAYSGSYPMPDQSRQLYIWNNTKWGRSVTGIYNWDGGDPVYKTYLGQCPVDKLLFARNRDIYEYALPGYSPYVYPHPLTLANSVTASPSASPTSGPAPLTVSFIGSAFGGTPPYTYHWNFGDGHSSASQNPTHVYTAAGTYTVTLTAIDSLGRSDDGSLSIQATSVSTPIVVSTSASPLSGQAPLTVSFTGTATGGAPPYTFNWDFGDGAYAGTQNPAHTYTAPGGYAAVLTVTDSLFSTASSSVAISVGSSGLHNLSLAAETGFPAPGPGGTTNPAPGNYTYPIGSSISLRSLPNIDYRFSRWNGDIPESGMFDSQVAVLINKDMTVSSTFCTKCGDVNGDLRISPADAQAAFDIFLGKTPNPTWCEKENADVNTSGTKLEPKVTPADAQMIFHKFLKKGEPGDCSGNSRSASMTLESLAPSPVRLSINSITAKRGEDVHVPILIDSSAEINAFGLDLAFPSRTLTFLGMQRTEFTQGYQDVGAHVLSPPIDYEGSLGRGHDQGIVRVGGYRTESVEGPTSGVLVVLAFRVTGEPEAGLSLSIIAIYDDLKDSALTNEMIQSRTERELVKKRRGFEQRSYGKGHGWW